MRGYVWLCAYGTLRRSMKGGHFNWIFLVRAVVDHFDTFIDLWMDALLIEGAKFQSFVVTWMLRWPICFWTYAGETPA